jgi:hypothetical protein
MDERRIWVGCLHCYNDGRLTGEWFDVDTTDESDINLETVHAHGKLTPHCEELWVMDHEGFAGIIDGEGDVSEFYEAALVIADILGRLYGDVDPDDLAAVLEHLRDGQGTDWSTWTIDDDHTSYSTYDDWADYAEQTCEEVYELDKLPGVLRYSIDWDHVGNEFRMDSWAYVERNGKLYIFNE